MFSFATLLQKIFLPSKFLVIKVFPTPPIKLKLGLQVGGTDKG
jgi:hypothetical protein